MMLAMAQITVVGGIIFFLVALTVHIIYSAKASRSALQTAQAYRIMHGKIVKLTESLEELNTALSTVLRFSEMVPANRVWADEEDTSDDDWSLPTDNGRYPLGESEKG